MSNLEIYFKKFPGAEIDHSLSLEELASLPNSSGQLVEAVLGKDHLLAREYQENQEDCDIPFFLAVSRRLYDDCSQRLGRLEIGQTLEGLTSEEALRNIFIHDRSIFWLTAINRVISALANGNHSSGRLVQVPVQLPNHKIGRIKMNANFAASNLGYFPGNEERYTFMAKEVRLPFKFLLPCPEEAYQGWLDHIIEIVGQLYRGEPLPLNQKFQSLWPDGLKLPAEAREELRRCGWLILKLYGKNFVAEPIIKPDDLGVLLFPINPEKHLPWINPAGDPNKYFIGWILPSLVHETTHITDFRAYAPSKTSSPILMETRALCAELAYGKQQLNLPPDSKTLVATISRLNPYLNILAGKPATTHVEVYYMENNKKGFAGLALPEQQRLIEALEKF